MTNEEKGNLQSGEQKKETPKGKEEEKKGEIAEEVTVGFYAIQHPTKNGEGWEYAKKKGVIAKSQIKEKLIKAIEAGIEKELYPALRLVYCELDAKNISHIKRVEQEFTVVAREEAKEREIPAELMHLITPETKKSLKGLPIEEVRNLKRDLAKIAEITERVNTKGVLFREKADFAKDTLKGKYEKVIAKLEVARERYLKAREDLERVREEKEKAVSSIGKKYPHIANLLRRGTTKTNTGKKRSEPGVYAEGTKKHQVREIFKDTKEHLGRSEVAELGKGKYDGVWKETSISPRIDELVRDGVLVQDEDKKFYLP
ncbi:MAG: hypothetical protein KAX49_17730 [Halanaerobiales bacterium]|nr:hypothetical protein [Halanaerobiales bacterium]